IHRSPSHLNLARFPALTHVLPPNSNFRVLPIYVARAPAAPFSPLPSRLCLDHSHCPVLVPATLAALPSTRAIPIRDVFYVGFPESSIPDRDVLYVAFPKRSIPSLATCSMSLFPKAPFDLSVCPSMSLDSCRL